MPRWRGSHEPSCAVGGLRIRISRAALTTGSDSAVLLKSAHVCSKLLGLDRLLTDVSTALMGCTCLVRKYGRGIAGGASGCTTRIPPCGASVGRQFCSSYISDTMWRTSMGAMRPMRDVSYCNGRTVFSTSSGQKVVRSNLSRPVFVSTLHVT